MQGLDPGNVVYCGSVSKTLAPALRLGWLVLPERLADDVGEQKAADDLGTPMVDQLALADFIARGPRPSPAGLPAGVSPPPRRARRRTGPPPPDAHVDGIAAGLHLVVRLLDGADESRVVDAARARGVGADGLSEHRFAPGPPALLLGYGRIPASAIAAAVHELVSSIDLTHR
jgi:GntR family transcriptional regulator / MocR family aminotransferase